MATSITCLDFTAASSERVNMGSIASTDNLALTSGGTICFWCKPDYANLDSFARVVSKSTGGFGAGGYAIYYNGSSRQFDIALNGGNRLSLPFKPTSGSEEWIHFAAVFNDTLVEGYINGAIIGENSGSGFAPPSTTADLWIGGDPSVGGRHWDGQIYDVRIYGSLLTDAQIQEIAFNLADSIGVTPLSQWKLDEGTGSTATDDGSEGVDGTLVNTPTWDATQELPHQAATGGGLALPIDSGLVR